MELKVLRAFVEVVRQGGFSLAGKVICASQSTVSKAVKQLEDDIGGSLLMRIGHTVRLTELGNVVYGHALIILNERDRLFADVEEIKSLRRGTLKLGIPSMGSGILFAPLVAEFRRRHPSIDISLQEQGAVRLAEMVQSREIDLGGLLLPISDDFEWQLVCDEPMVALLPPSHPLGDRTSVRLRELASSPLILFEKSFALNGVIDTACRNNGFSPREAGRSGQPEFIVALVASGLGVGMLPRLVIENLIHRSINVALIDEPQLRWRIVMAWRRGDYLSQAARAWLDLIRGIHAKETTASA
jgi:DNA-binding transcriptional LysR family regulator